MRHTIRSGLCAGVLALPYAVLGCARSEPAPTAPPTSPAPTHYLDEWFDVGAARCRIDRVERALLEQRAGEGQVAEDVLLVDTRWACTDAAQHAIEVATLLPKHGPVTWIDDQHVTHLRSPRRGVPNHVYFAVPTQHDGLLRPRKYDARSGEPQGTRELREARITLAGGAVVAPWPRMHDRAVDARIDQLVRTLATNAAADAPGERAALALASALYRQALETFAPRVVAVRSPAAVEGQPRLVLAFERCTSEEALAQRFELAFELALGPEGPRVLRVVDPEGARTQLTCAEARRALAARVEHPHDGTQTASHGVGAMVRGAAGREERAQRTLVREHAPQRAVADRAVDPAPGDAVQCNVLKTLLPGRCDDLPSELLTHALRVGTRCGDGGAVGLDPDDSISAPDDFEVHLRRGRAPASLDRSPRYQLTLAATGEVRFQGDHWVSRLGPSSGRTSARMLGALYAHVARLGWFERPAPRTTRRCRKDDYGDLFRLRAGGHERMLRDRDGCREGFSAQELETLRLAIERVAGVDAWTAPSSSQLAPRDDQIWVVAAE